MKETLTKSHWNHFQAKFKVPKKRVFFFQTKVYTYIQTTPWIEREKHAVKNCYQQLVVDVKTKGDEFQWQRQKQVRSNAGTENVWTWKCIQVRTVKYKKMSTGMNCNVNECMYRYEPQVKKK